MYGDVRFNGGRIEASSGRSSNDVSVGVRVGGGIVNGIEVGTFYMNTGNATLISNGGDAPSNYYSAAITAGKGIVLSPNVVNKLGPDYTVNGMVGETGTVYGHRSVHTILDASNAIATDVKITTPKAEVSDATIDGATGTAITPSDVTITLTLAQFKQMTAGDDVSGWFINMPAGLTAQIKENAAANAKNATVAISGTPTDVSTEAMTITVEANALVSGVALEQSQQMTPTSDAGLHEKTSRALAGIVGIALGVESNDDAKWNISKVPFVTVVKQAGVLIYATDSSATFGVTPRHFIVEPSVYTFEWIGGAPTGITIGKSINAPSITASIDLNTATRTQAQIYYFKLIAENNATTPVETATSGMVTLTVSPKFVTVTGIKALDKKYDGKTDATLDYSDVKIEGMVGSDILTATATGTFADAYPETDKTVNISDIKLYQGGVETANYTADTRTSQTTAIASIYRQTRTVATPVITPKGASSINPWEVSITCPTLGAAVYYTLDGSEPTSGSPAYEKPFTVGKSCVVKARAMLSGWNQSAVASEEYVLTEPTKPYILHLDGIKEEFETITDALNAALPGELVIVPGETELTGDLEVPSGVSLSLNNSVYTNSQNAGRLIIHKDGTVSTLPGEHIEINGGGKALSKSEENAVYFTGLDVSGTLISGGTIKLTNVKATGDGFIEMVATGEITLDGEAAVGKVRLAKGRTVTLGEDFTASEKAATLLLGDDYELGHRALIFANESQGKYAKYFALGDAPDDSWYIGEDGLLTCKVAPEESYLLHDKLTLGKGKKVNLSNLLPLKFKGGTTWTSSDESVFKIVGKGKKKYIKPLNNATANLTVVFADGKSETIPVTVVEKKKAATGLTLKGKLTMKTGAQKMPKANVTPASATDKTLKWFTTDEKIAKVCETGVITAVSKGKCKVYAITTAGARKVISVTVKK